MKRFKLLLIVTFFIASCTITPQQKAEKAVKNYLKENLKDWKSYEGLSFSFSEGDYPTTYGKGSYYISHKYRAKNGFGAYDIYNQTFILNKNFSIIESYD